MAKLLHTGLINPVTVRSAADAGITSHEWHLVAGHRRFIAATEILKWDRIECNIVYNCTDRCAKRINLLENLGRKDLHPGQEAEAIVAVYGETPDIDEVASDLGMSKAWIRRRLQIRTLNQNVRPMFFDGRLSAFDLSLLLAAAPEEQEILAASLLKDKAAGLGSNKIARQRGKTHKTRGRGEVQAMITRLLDERKRPTCWQALAWSVGGMSDEELLQEAEPMGETEFI